jgi:hypothetical protein
VGLIATSARDVKKNVLPELFPGLWKAPEKCHANYLLTMIATAQYHAFTIAQVQVASDFVIFNTISPDRETAFNCCKLLSVFLSGAVAPC